ncbi:phosphatase PAP2 family protein [uncultured Sphingomonas sp.]|uniref:phosphatase PAP2 family protein n=1 Tax=uncultured Sphingomonas sp. TaxID=158754 RepID=UPI0035CB3B16
MMDFDLTGVGDALLRADKAVSHRLARHRDHPVARTLGWLAEVADQPQLVSLSIATIAVGGFIGRRDLVRGGTRMLAAEVAATAAKAVVKRLVERSRPGHALETGDDRFRAGDRNDHELTSFPSGHTAGAVAVARAATREIDGIAVPAALATAFVAVAQAPSGHHYLGDVAVGAAVGWLAEALVDRAFGYLDNAPRPSPAMVA